MMAATVLLAILAASAPASVPACMAVTQRHFEHLSELPRGAAEAMGMSMADKGRPFQAGMR
ncbi:MAG: hypothetical protein QM690_18290 [Sphingobium sp.]